MNLSSMVYVNQRLLTRYPHQTFFLLQQNITKGLDVPYSIVWTVCSLVSTRVGVIRRTCRTETDPGVATDAVVNFVTDNTDSCFIFLA